MDADELGSLLRAAQPILRKTPEDDVRGDMVARLRRSEYGQRRNDAGHLVDITLQNGDTLLVPPAVQLAEGSWPGLSTNLLDRHEVVWTADAPTHGWTWDNPVAQLKTSLSAPSPGHDFRYFRYRRLVEEKIPTGIALDKDEPNHVTIVVTQEQIVDSVLDAECNLPGVADLDWVPHSIVRFEFAPDTPEARAERKAARKARKAAKKEEQKTHSSDAVSSGGGGGSSGGDGAGDGSGGGGGAGAGVGPLSNVCSVLSTVMADTWSADLVEEAQTVLEELEDGMDDIEEGATAQSVAELWVGAEARVRSILRDFVGSSSFHSSNPSHVRVQQLFAAVTPASSTGMVGFAHLAKAAEEVKKATDVLGFDFAALLTFSTHAAMEAIQVPVAQRVAEPSTRRATDPEVPKTTRATDYAGARGAETL